MKKAVEELVESRFFETSTDARQAAGSAG